MDREETAVARTKPESFLEVLEKVATTPGLSVDVIERMLAVQERLIADQRKTAFMAAMTRLQATLPPITKYGQAKNSKYAKLEDINAVIRPLVAAEGFSITFDEESHTDKTVTFVMTFAHEAGHAEAKRLTVPIDSAASNREGKAIRPAIQDAGSTVSYARRYLLKMHLNLIEAGEDTDGESREPITAEQVKDLDAMITEVHADKPRFLKYMNVESLEQILSGDYTKAVTALESKRRQ